MPQLATEEPKTVVAGLVSGGRLHGRFRDLRFPGVDEADELGAVNAVDREAGTGGEPPLPNPGVDGGLAFPGVRYRFANGPPFLLHVVGACGRGRNPPGSLEFLRGGTHLVPFMAGAILLRFSVFMVSLP